MEKIPVRATMFSAISVVPYVLIICIFYSFGLEKNQIGISSRMVMLVLAAIRSPLIGLKKLYTKSFFKQLKKSLQAFKVEMKTTIEHH